MAWVFQSLLSLHLSTLLLERGTPMLGFDNWNLCYDPFLKRDDPRPLQITVDRMGTRFQLSEAVLVK